VQADLSKNECTSPHLSITRSYSFFREKGAIERDWLTQPQVFKIISGVSICLCLFQLYLIKGRCWRKQNMVSIELGSNVTRLHLDVIMTVMTTPWSLLVAQTRHMKAVS